MKNFSSTSHRKVDIIPFDLYLKLLWSADYATGFGGKYGVQSDRVDKSAVGWEHHEKVDKHESQTDYSKGFGGKYGVQSDRKDKFAHGWDEVTKTEKHSSQTDSSRGFGGKFGVESDRVDKSAHSWTREESEANDQSGKTVDKEFVSKGNANNLRARFENMAKNDESEAKKRAEEERKRRSEREEQEKEAAKKAEEERQEKLQLQRQQESDHETEEEEEKAPVRESVSSPRVNKIGISVFPKMEFSPNRVSESFKQTHESKNQEKEEEEETKWEAQNEPIRQVTNENVQVIKTSDFEQRAEDKQHPEEEEESQDFGDRKEAVAEESGLTATALYDYQAADFDEISFDPDEVISDIEMIDEGWWRGRCRGKVGLFPANYVQLNQWSQWPQWRTIRRAIG